MVRMLLQPVSERTSSPLRCQRHPRAPKVWWCVEGPERAYAAHARPSPSGVVAYDPTVTPCHEEPLPAVQPKQWLLVATALPVSSSKFSTS